LQIKEKTRGVPIFAWKWGACCETTIDRIIKNHVKEEEAQIAKPLEDIDEGINRKLAKLRVEHFLSLN
ncbi:hypothetical protein U2086_14825, partial [Listeria monocytogenes]|uniref:hypothetical protein n=1 Tax=Listeria monocytogenes TaxID=1639 RepID=UPI002FDC732C